MKNTYTKESIKSSFFGFFDFKKTNTKANSLKIERKSITNWTISQTVNFCSKQSDQSVLDVNATITTKNTIWTTKYPFDFVFLRSRSFYLHSAYDSSLISSVCSGGSYSFLYTGIGEVCFRDFFLPYLSRIKVFCFQIVYYFQILISLFNSFDTKQLSVITFQNSGE